MLNGKATSILFTVGLIKKTLYELLNIFVNQENMKIESGLFNYATKVDLKTQQVLIHRNFPEKFDLDSLKS